uniref:Cilia- and flagella-associated protein 157 n=1 Tax=Dicentrarchus labrax TaxID=13489 RepID=A0A8C4GIC1_DICLA
MADKIGSCEKEKSFYLIQISYLDEKLERYQLKCDELEKQNKDLTSRYNALQKDKKDITESLKRSLVPKERKAEELSEQLEGQRQVAEQDREALKLQHCQQIQELQERIDELHSVSKMQGEQKAQLMQQLSGLESLEKQVVSQKEEHEAAISSLRMAAKLERENMKEDMQKTVEDTVKTKTLTILQKERAQHSERLVQIEFLLNYNTLIQKETDAIRAGESDLCIKRDNVKEELRKTGLEISTHKKEMKKQKRKCQKLEVKLKDHNITHKHMLAKEMELRKALVSVSEECRQKSEEARQLGPELQGERSRRGKLEAIVSEAVIILKHIMEEDAEEGPDTEWKTERLLHILESTAPQGTGSALDEKPQKPKISQVTGGVPN